MNSTSQKKKLDLKYQPATLDEFIGVAKPKAILKAFLEEPCSESFILAGDSGTGKTTMAYAAAAALGALPGIGGGLVDVPAGKCDKERVDDLYHQCHYAPMMGSPFWVIIVNEADKMSLAAQHALLSKLDCSDQIPNTVWFFTTNDMANLEDRFVSRCKVLKFTTDGLLEPGIDLLKRIWTAERKGKPKASAPDFRAILREAKLNIREALNVLELEIMCPGSFEPSMVHIDQNGTGRLYTVGYMGMKPKGLKEIMDTLVIDVLVDCRINPKTKVPGFDGTELEKAYGGRYTWRGEILGNRGRTTEAGLGWLVSLVEDGQRVLLLASETAPGMSHRYSDIAVPLLKRGIDALHLCEEELVGTAALKRAIDEDRRYTPRYWRKEAVA